MKNYIGQKVLITTSGWFYGTDGKQYRGVFGTLRAVHEAGASLGFIPNRAHANWFIEVGELIVMGCQVMYVLRTDNPPPTTAPDWGVEQGARYDYDRPSSIFITT